MLWYRFDDDLTNDGTALAGDGVAHGGDVGFASGSEGRWLQVGPGSHVSFAGIGELLGRASGLTFSLWVRAEPDSHGTTLLGCRSYDRGFEAYASDRRRPNHEAARIHHRHTW
jgi:hypothetical protein